MKLRRTAPEGNFQEELPVFSVKAVLIASLGEKALCHGADPVAFGDKLGDVTSLKQSDGYLTIIRKRRTPRASPVGVKNPRSTR